MAPLPEHWLDRLLTEREGRLRSFLRRRGRPEAEVADLSQEIYLRLLRVRDPEAIANPEAYLFTVAGNLLRERAMVAKRQGRTVPVEEAEGEEHLWVTLDTGSEVDGARRRQRLFEVLQELPPKCRAAVVLHYRDGMTCAAIGTHLGVSGNMVKKYLARALEHCRRRMGSLA